jgi:serine/threonine-protein kinase HipA
VARNQDDHVKNIAFLMNKAGEWRLAPAFDVTYSYNPSGNWTATHQMTINGKRDGFLKADIRAAGRSAGLKQGRADTLLDEVTAAVERWPAFAARAKVPEGVTKKIRQAHSLDLGGDTPLRR